MQSFTTVTGVVAPLDAVNVDTDAIIPKQFLKRIERKGFGQFLFYDWRYENGQEKPEFVLNKEPYRNAPILLTRKNFGCGSSREHAPWALSEFGIRVILAPSFADIFHNNCFKNGILPIVLPEEVIQSLFQQAETQPGFELSVDLASQSVKGANGFKASFEIAPYRKQLLLEGLDEVGATLKAEDRITEFEEKHKVFYQLSF
ncbi:3-isopropylmalate dehydratase small subunit [Mesobacillus maritimus]|uniref:3-isopropylmalate dehydratase small subunit n=1 Tax=Mesobacillus maritimus TaxID=1643336 RepID=UPI00203CAB17|nr:3-isopropylmalate dehydratase small subunit [Mesobacillus maritimus]MCM3584954.1 3-isopropylmalate dehydratase small subunit [Mesobacillus maritimus]